MKENNMKLDLISLKVCKEKTLNYNKLRQFTSPEMVYRVVKKILDSTDREYLLVLNLNAQNQACSIQVCSIGSLTSTMVHPREIFKSAICTNSDKILLVHTHPSGCTKPSKSDIQTTQILLKASKILGIPLVDHVIVGDSYFSFAENGLLGE